MFVLQHAVYVCVHALFPKPNLAFYRTRSPFLLQFFMLTFAGICGSQHRGQEHDAVSTPA